MTARLFGTLGAVLAGLAVAAGAFAAHALQHELTERAIATVQTAAQYQMTHAVALILVALSLAQIKAAERWLQVAGIAFLVGILLFSGSLYALSLSGLRELGILTPIGGVAFLVGWSCFAIAARQFPS